MRILALSLRERHVGRWVKVGATHRKPGVEGVLEKFGRHLQGFPRSGYVTLTVRGVQHSVPWYRRVRIVRRKKEQP